MPDTTLSILSEIRTKVRRLTRNPSEAQLSTTELDKYVNVFILYDIPEHLRLNTLQKSFTFYANPYIDRYDTNTVDPNDPLYNFKNKVISVHGPAYIAGVQAFFSQSPEQFYAMYPKAQGAFNIGTGDGATVNFAGTLSQVPIIRSEVLFSSVDINDDGLGAYDDGEGVITGDVVLGGVINYVTGVYDFTFSVAPGVGKTIYAQVVPYVASRPSGILYFDTQFILRPIPDQPYKIDIQVYLRPTELLAADQSPDLAEWWQYIAYGAAKKIFEDRTDQEGIGAIMPEFKKQETLILRRTVMQLSNERVATIYTETVPFVSRKD